MELLQHRKKVPKVEEIMLVARPRVCERFSGLVDLELPSFHVAHFLFFFQFIQQQFIEPQYLSGSGSMAEWWRTVCEEHVCPTKISVLCPSSIMRIVSCEEPGSNLSLACLPCLALLISPHLQYLGATWAPPLSWDFQAQMITQPFFLSSFGYLWIHVWSSFCKLRFCQETLQMYFILKQG